MPLNTVDKVTRHLRASLGTLMLLEIAASVCLLVFAGVSSTTLLTFTTLWISVSISAWAYHGTKKKNPRLLSMYVGMNAGVFISVLLSLAVIVVLVAIQAGKQHSQPMDLVFASGEQPMDLQPVEIVPGIAVPLPNGQPQMHAVALANEENVVGQFKVAVVHKQDAVEAEDPETTTLADSAGASTDGETHPHHKCTSYMFIGFGIFVGWLTLKFVSVILAWRLRKAYLGLPFCGGKKTKRNSRSKKSKEMTSVSKAPVAYAPTPYYIVVPQQGEQYMAPKFSV